MWRFSLLLGAAALLIAGPAALAADPEFQPLGKEGDFSLAPPDVSEGSEAGWYLRGDGGYVLPQMGTVTIDRLPLPVTSDLDAGWSVGAGLGYRFAGPFRIEAGLDYLALGSSDTAAGALGVDATVALASIYWDMITIAGFTPYVGGGVGLANVSVDGPAGIATSGGDWGLAFSLGAGMSYAITAQWSVDLGYRYIDLGGRSATTLLGLPSLEVDGLAAHQVRLGVRYQVQ